MDQFSPTVRDMVVCLTWGLSMFPLSQTALASEPPDSFICEADSAPSSFTSEPSDRWALVNDLNTCLEQYGDRHIPDTTVDTLQQQLNNADESLQTTREDLVPLESTVNQLEAQTFSPTTKLSGLTVMGLQYGDSVGDRPLISPLSGEALPASRPSTPGITFLTLNTSFEGNDLLKATFYVANRANDFLSEARIGNSDSNNRINTFFIPSRTVWTLVPETLSLYRLSYQFKPASDVTVTVGPKFLPTDIIDKNSFTNPITTFNSWSMIGNSLITPYQMRLIGGAGAGIDWNIDGGPLSLRGVYIARAANAAASSTEEGGLFSAPYQGSVELEYRDQLSDRDYLALQLQYTHSDTSGIEQDVLGLNAELGLGNVGLFGRFGQSWAQAEAGVNPLPFSNEDAGRFRASLFQAGVAVKDLGLERSLLSVAVGQPFRTTLDPAPGIPKEFQTNLEAFYRLPLSNNLYLSPTVLAVFNPNNRDDQPTLIQGFLRFTVLY